MKGGLFLYSLTGFDSRVTVDVDFLLRKIPNTPEQLKGILEEIIVVHTENDFVAFEINSVVPISVTKKYAGISASIIAHIKNAPHHLALISVLVMLLYRSRKSEKYPLSLMALLRQSLILIPLKRPLLRKLTQSLA